MASSTIATRRVLGDLNVNTPAGARSIGNDIRSNTGSPEKPRKVAEGVSLQVLFESKISSPVCEEVQLASAKRNSELVEDVRQSPKRQKRDTCLEPGFELDMGVWTLEEIGSRGNISEGDLQSKCPGVCLFS